MKSRPHALSLLLSSFSLSHFPRPSAARRRLLFRTRWLYVDRTEWLFPINGSQYEKRTLLTMTDRIVIVTDTQTEAATATQTAMAMAVLLVLPTAMVLLMEAVLVELEVTKCLT